MTRIIVAAACLACLASPLLAEEKASRALAEYLAKKDDSYTWQKRSGGSLAGVEYAELRLTSQTWRGIPWRHRLFVIKPPSVKQDVKHALLFISGGGWRAEYDDPDFKTPVPREATLFAALAAQLQSPVAILLDVPHQPLFNGMYEDQIIAYTFEKYLDTNEKDWPLLLPMVKSAAKAMDAVQEQCQKEWSLPIETFTVTGASKRGWTTWLAGAADDRVTAIAPMVIDMLNMSAQMKHQVATWGDYSYQIEDYTRRGLQKRIHTQEGERLRAIVDPYSYRDKLDLPKLIILGTNDHYWPLDALNLYWDGLNGDKHILYVPNNGHGLNDYPRLIGTLGALHAQAAGGPALPKLDWKFELEEGKLTLHVKSDAAPQRVSMWRAASENRDFRQARWTSSSSQQKDGAYVCELPAPEAGFAAMFAEAVFEGPQGPFYLSTNVRIVEPMAAE